MYTEEGIYRISDHWGFGIATCSWMLDGCTYECYSFMDNEKEVMVGVYGKDGKEQKEYYKEGSEMEKCGFASWEDFIFEPNIFERVNLAKEMVKTCCTA